jgi:hypothetical protein
VHADDAALWIFEIPEPHAKHLRHRAVNQAIAQRWVCSWTIDQVQDYLSVPATLKGKRK